MPEIVVILDTFPHVQPYHLTQLGTLTGSQTPGSDAVSGNGVSGPLSEVSNWGEAIDLSSHLFSYLPMSTGQGAG